MSAVTTIITFLRRGSTAKVSLLLSTDSRTKALRTAALTLAYAVHAIALNYSSTKLNE